MSKHVHLLQTVLAAIDFFVVEGFFSLRNVQLRCLGFQPEPVQLMKCPSCC